MNNLPVTFIWPQFLWLLLALPLLVLIYWWLLRRRRHAALRYASLSIVREAMGKGPGWRRHVPPLLLLHGDSDTDVPAKLAQRLQLPILFFRQNLDADRGGHVQGAVLRLVFFPCLERCAVVADASTALRAFAGTVDENEFACLLVVADDVRLTTSGFHLLQ